MSTKTTAQSAHETWIERRVLEELAADMAIPVEQLQMGALSEERGWPALTQAVKRFSRRWNAEAPRMSALRTVIERIDAAYYARA